MSDVQADSVNWRTIGVKRERNHDALIARLSADNKSIFQYLKDLMVFAAMVGYSRGERREVEGDTVEIILETYATDEKDGFIYLLGLLEHRDGHILKDQNLRKCVEVFEGYCNAGLYIIEGWLDDNPGDPSGIETLLHNIYSEMIENESSDETSNEEIEIEV
ncbi:MAG: hypothetical protein AWU57_93 [Marinobacter sp. T13-3]|nr:MAG: hypothetical protein AWU57_93 [Marinobacter sp. T13-3]